MSTTTIKPPPLRFAMLEQYSLVEYAGLALAGPWKSLIARGDDQPVLVLPGFTASDRSTKPLRDVLRDRGFRAHGWGLGQNLGPRPRIVDGLQERLGELRDRYGCPVSVVGWSLGGIYARELARSAPESVRQVVTLASPFRFRGDDRSRVQRLYDVLAPAVDPFPERLIPEDARPPLDVPTSAIYTRTDGVVAWQACIEVAGAQRENIRVLGTHNGLGFNFGAVVAVADRLAQPEGTWAPFRPSLALRGWYGRPDAWRSMS